MKRTTQKRSTQSPSDAMLQKRRELLACIVESTGEAIFSITHEGCVTTWNRGAEELYGYTEQEAIGKEAATLLWSVDALAEAYSLCERACQGVPLLNVETFHVRKDGEQILVDMTLSPLRNISGECLGLSVVARDITERLREQAAEIQEWFRRLEAQKDELETLNARIDTVASTDSLTGLKNRRILDETVEQECQRATRYGTPLSLILLDIDVFRHIQQTRGIPAGDEILEQMANLLLQEARTTDLVGYYDEGLFCIVLPNTDRAGAVVTAERLRQQIEAASWPQQRLTVSVGAATFSHTMETGSALIVEAHKALYLSRHGGGNHVTHFDAREDFASVQTGWAATRIRTYLESITPLSSRRNNVAVVAANASSLRISRKELAHAYDTTIEGWSRALDRRDKEAEGHSQRVMEMTVRLAQAMGIRGQELVYMRWGALLHDIGKMGVPDSILLKPGPLTPAEWEVMRTHTTLAFEMLSSIAFMHPALDIPFSHHERWDGTGYPQGLKGEEIPLAARIFAVVDVWDALRSDRPYRKAWSEREALDHIYSLSDRHFDPQVVQAFHHILTADKIGGTDTLAAQAAWEVATK